MGTNYYLESDVCPHCGRSAERLHIGKSSAGWCFSLHIIPERGINDLSYWMAEFSKPNTKIVDEYGDAVPVNQMLAVITERGRDSAIWEKKPYGYDSWSEFHRENHSEQGPKGLLRHRAGNMGVRHGAGTYDLCPYEFS